MNTENTLLFLGDVVPYKPFIFRNNLKTIINLECPIVKNGIPVTGKINLAVRENHLTKIFDNNLLCVSLGNNHILDYGLEGLDTTLYELEKSDIKYFGINFPGNNRYNPLITDFNNVKIAFLSVICESTSPVVEFDDFNHLSLLNTDELIEKVRSLKNEVDRIVISIHWGIEESSYPTREDILTARSLVDAGVDLIIGTHAHAPQPVEKYHNGIIAYNLGNFIMPKFDNTPSYFDEKGIPQSDFSKLLMLWNRISWGLAINMENLEYKIKKYSFIANQIIELPSTPLDKFINIPENVFDESYESVIKKHLKRRAILRKIRHFIHNPHIPNKLRRK